MEVKLVAPLNASVLIVCNEELRSKVTDVKSVAFLNARNPISVTDLGISIEVKPVFKNESLPIVANEEGASNVIDDKSVVPWNAKFPISVTVLGI